MADDARRNMRWPFTRLPVIVLLPLIPMVYVVSLPIFAGLGAAERIGEGWSEFTGIIRTLWKAL